MFFRPPKSDLKIHELYHSSYLLEQKSPKVLKRKTSHVGGKESFVGKLRRVFTKRKVGSILKIHPDHVK